MNSQNVSVGRKVLNAIQKLQGSKGISLLELKKFLRDAKKMDVGQFNTEIKLALKSYMDRDILSREDGLYKVNESKRRARSRSKGGSKRSRSRRRSGSRKKGASKRKSSGKGKRSGSRRRRRRKASPEE